MSVSYYGELFDVATITPPIKLAARETRDFGLAMIKLRSPVRTGALRDGWTGTLEGFGIRWEDPVHYTIYQEMGTRFMPGKHMLSRSMPEIRDYFKKRLAYHVGKRLAGKIIGQLGADPTQSYTSPMDSAAYGQYTNQARQVQPSYGFKNPKHAGKNYAGT
jgi:hypothetical protein